MDNRVRFSPQPRPLRRALAAAAVLVAVLPVFTTVAPAAAITRTDVVARASRWVKAGVPYSQSGYYQGYRRDCSGLVSMSWALKSSLTTRTLGSVSTRIPLKQLQPGDAVLTPGHVTIFAGWANSQRTAYISLEEANSRLDAVRRVRPIRGVGLRYTGITAAPAPKPVAKPAPVIPARPRPWPVLLVPELPDASNPSHGAATPVLQDASPRIMRIV